MQKGYFDENNVCAPTKDVPEPFWKIDRNDNRGEPLRIKQSGGRKWKGENHKTRFKTKKLVWGVDSTKDDVVIIIEEIEELREPKNVAIRFGYRTITDEKAKHHPGVWWWGQSALMIQLSDLHELLDYARSKKFDLIGSHYVRSESM
jgi:hypothetical protein